jgi:DNA helicase II / ATP-dependent DNA helicase PcrA
MKDLLADLNEQQQEVVKATHGPVLVLAGAGSGKTRALTYRIAYLVQQKVAMPHEILAVTFTNKAAGEMKERVSQLVGGGNNVPSAISTFHSLGAKILREQSNHLPRSHGFIICDASDSDRLIRSAMEELRISKKEYSYKGLKSQISKAKNMGITAKDIAEKNERHDSEVVAKVFSRYEKLLEKNDAYDFDDLLIAPLRLLNKEEGVRKIYQNRWRFLCVDEYQDTNPPQDALLKLITEEKNNICVVGDDYQAIYSWRGAKVDHILHFETAHPDCKTIYLTRNYRSTSAILEAANQVIAENVDQKHKKLWTAKKGGKPVEVVALPSGKREVEWVREQIEDYVSGGNKRGDNVVLYRTNAQSRVLEEEFLTHGIPYNIVGGFRFYERREIKDALAFLRWMINPDSSLAVERLSDTTWRGIGPKTIANWKQKAETDGVTLMDIVSEESKSKAVLKPMISALQEAMKKEFDTVSDLIEFILTKSGYLTWLKKLVDGEERMENIEELFNVTSAYSDVEKFLEEVSLLTDIDSASGGEDRVTCMTLHAAKGLEYARVFLVGCEDGLLPHINSIGGNNADLEEERRLMYVGMTRAKEKLYISHASTRFVRGDVVSQIPSRFLRDLPSTVRHNDYSMQTNVGFGGSDNLMSDSFGDVGLSNDSEPVTIAYEEGDFVNHDQFGKGVVIEIRGSLMTCVFENHGIKTIDGELVRMN